MRTSRLGGLLLAALLAGTLGLGAVGAPAFADRHYPPAPVTPATPAPVDPLAKDLTWHNCHIVSGPNYIGGVCAGAASEGKSPKDILGKDDVPDCWDEAVSDEDLAAMGKANVPGPGGITYYWRSCLSGIDKKTKEVEPGGMQIKTWLSHLDNGTPPQTLTANQQILVNGVADRQNVPDPVAVVSPADHPRVGLNVAFLNGSKGEVDVRPLGAVIHAHVDHTSVQPLGKDTPPTIDCPGNGAPATPDQERVEGDGLCWYRYLHSSAGQPQGYYQVQITSHWVVEISPTGEQGTFEPLDQFTKSAITPVPVTEIQALVVQ